MSSDEVASLFTRGKQSQVTKLMDNGLHVLKNYTTPVVSMDKMNRVVKLFRTAPACAFRKFSTVSILYTLIERQIS